MGTENNPVVWFEIPVSDMSRAKGFYEHVLGLQLEVRQMEEMQMALFNMGSEAYGATGSLVSGEHYTPSSNGVVVYFTTPDIEAALSRGEEKGGKTLKAKMSIGEYGFIGLLLDSEVNRIGLHSMS
jgi:hypothetical protein